MLTHRSILSRTLSAAALTFAFLTAASAATTPADAPKAATPPQPPVEIRALWLSDLNVAALAPDTHAEICLKNEQTCLKGCDGAVSCSNQCKVNYENCMKQGQ